MRGKYAEDIDAYGGGGEGEGGKGDKVPYFHVSLPVLHLHGSIRVDQRGQNGVCIELLEGRLCLRGVVLQQVHDGLTHLKMAIIRRDKKREARGKGERVRDLFIRAKPPKGYHSKCPSIPTIKETS